jgi:hypothetical protein
MIKSVVSPPSDVEILVRRDGAVEFSEDGVLVTRSTRVLAERADAVSDIREHLVSEEHFADNHHPHCRQLTIRGHKA